MYKAITYLFVYLFHSKESTPNGACLCDIILKFSKFSKTNKIIYRYLYFVNEHTHTIRIK